MGKSSEQQGCVSRDGTLLTFQREPPTTIQQGATFTVIVRVVFGRSWSHPDAQMQTCALNISLIDEHGACSQHGLRGSLTSCLRLCPGQHANGVVVFDKLSAQRIGPHRLRVLLGKSSSAGMSIEARQDSQVFQVSAISESL